MVDVRQRPIAQRGSRRQPLHVILDEAVSKSDLHKLHVILSEAEGSASCSWHTRYGSRQSCVCTRWEVRRLVRRKQVADPSASLRMTLTLCGSASLRSLVIGGGDALRR